MPPKDDPYASRSNRILDLILVAFVIGVILLTILTAPNLHSSDPATAGSQRTELTAK